MKFFDKLERKLGRFAIPHLMIYLIALYVAGYFIISYNPLFYAEYLALDASKLLKGQVWRIITYLCYPPHYNLMLCLLYCYLYYIMGRFLEKIQGTFRFNVYIFTGILGQVIAAILIYLISGQVYILTPSYIYTTMFLAIAATFPNMQFYLYFVVLFKAKWLGLLYGVFIGYNLVRGNWADRIAIILSFLNFILFFLIARRPVQQAKQFQRRTEYRREAAPPPKGVPRHRCAVCGITDLDAPDMEFRFCTKCDGNLEYCMNHLYTHVHVHNQTGPQ